MPQQFLSDLCGREDKTTVVTARTLFLSDLCGREEYLTHKSVKSEFLSDLCGREVKQVLK